MRWSIAALLLCSSLLLGSARADDEDKPRPPQHSLARPSERLSNEERQERTDKSLEKMRDLSQQTQKLLEQAKDEKDLVKLNCVTERLGQVRGLVKVAVDALAELKDAIARKDDEAADHEFTKVALSQAKVVALRADAEQCIGQLAFFTDEKTLVDVEVPALTKADPTWIPAPRAIELRQPPASGL
jgi:hypothetical protein